MKTRTPIHPVVIRRKSYLLPLAVVAACLLLAMSMDYRIELIETHRAAAASDARLLDCLNGVARWQGADGTEIGCMRAETN